MAEALEALMNAVRRRVDDDPLYDIPGFAQLCGGISPLTVEAWLSQRRIDRVKIGRRTMIRASQLDRVIAESRPKATIDAEASASVPVPAAQPAKRTSSRRPLSQPSP